MNKKRNLRGKGLRIDILTIFPNIFDSYLNESLFRRAQKNGVLDIRVHNLRDYTKERHKKVDDRPFGGGPGMVLQVEPIHRAIQTLIKGKRPKPRVVLFGIRGKKFTSREAQRLAKYGNLIFICGRYEGVDERVARHIADEEISIGDYVLSGGELPALVVSEAVARFRSGFLGKYASLEEVKGSYPVYAKPEVFSPKKNVKWRVPKVLLSGHHKDIATWRGRT